MRVELPDSALEGTGMTPETAVLELAVALYRDRKVTMGRACEIAGLPRVRFQRELARRGVTIDYSVADLHDDLEALRSVGLP